MIKQPSAIQCKSLKSFILNVGKIAQYCNQRLRYQIGSRLSPKSDIFKCNSYHSSKVVKCFINLAVLSSSVVR